MTTATTKKWIVWKDEAYGTFSVWEESTEGAGRLISARDLSEEEANEIADSHNSKYGLSR